MAYNIWLAATVGLDINVYFLGIQHSFQATYRVGKKDKREKDLASDFTFSGLGNLECSE